MHGRMSFELEVKLVRHPFPASDDHVGSQGKQSCNSSSLMIQEAGESLMSVDEFDYLMVCDYLLAFFYFGVG